MLVSNYPHHSTYDSDWLLTIVIKCKFSHNYLIIGCMVNWEVK